MPANPTFDPACIFLSYNPAAFLFGLFFGVGQGWCVCKLEETIDQIGALRPLLSACRQVMGTLCVFFYLSHHASGFLSWHVWASSSLK